MKRAAFVLGSFDYRSIKKGDAYPDATLDMLDGIATHAGVNAGIVTCIQEPMHAGWSKSKLGIKRIRAEQARVLDEITAMRPDVVIAFGPVASACIWGKGNLVEGELLRKEHRPMGDEFAPVFVTFSLENCKYSAGLQKWLKLDVEAAVHGWGDPEFGDYDILLPGTPEWDVKPEWLTMEDGYVGWDLETYPGLDPWHPDARIRMGMLSDRRGKGVVVQATPDSTFPQWYLDILYDPVIVKSGSNIKFDMRWHQRFYGFVPGPVKDTSTTEHTIDESNPRKDLKSLTFRYAPWLGDYSKAHRDLVRERGGWEFVADDEQYSYAGADAESSYCCIMGQRQIIKDRGLQVPDRILTDLYPVLARMEIAGSCIDRDANRDLDALYTKKLAELRAEIVKHLGPINPNSVPQLAAALKKAAPTIKLTKRTWERVLGDEENEEVNTSRAVLEREAFKHPSIPVVLEYRKHRVRHSTFIRGVFEKHLVEHGGKWYVHPTYRADVTSTYRLSSQGPNDQNAPRKDADPDLTIKRQVVSRFPGGKIIDVDQSQAEIRVAAYLAQDEKMMAAILSGEDIHTSMASIMLDKPPEEVSDLERTECKARTFLILYGGGAGKLARDLSISKRAAQVLIDEYFGTFTGLKDFINATHAIVREKLQVKTIFGFVRRFVAPAEHWDSPDGWSVQRMAFNTLVQSAAVVLSYLAMIRFDRECRKRKLKSVLIKFVHDSMVIDVHPDEVDEVAVLAQECMESATKLAEDYGVFGINVPLKSDVMIGDNWGILEPWTPTQSQGDPNGTRQKHSSQA